jgi:hypothetical protein
VVVNVPLAEVLCLRILVRLMVVVDGWVVVFVLMTRRQMGDLHAMTRIVHDVQVRVIVDNSVVRVHHRRSSLSESPPILLSSSRGFRRKKLIWLACVGLQTGARVVVSVEAIGVAIARCSGRRLKLAAPGRFFTSST